MKSIYYITLLIGFGCFGLAGCAEVPIAKTNCWATAGSTVTTSTKGARPASGLAPLVEVVTVEPAVAQQLVLAIGTSAQPARPEHPTPISKVM